MKNLKKHWEEVSKIKVFEVPVTDARTKEDEYIIFYISIIGDYFVAEHEPLNLKQEQSDKVAFVSVDIDSSFSLDENLEYLFSECMDAVTESSYFNLKY